MPGSSVSVSGAGRVDRHLACVEVGLVERDANRLVGRRVVQHDHVDDARVARQAEDAAREAVPEPRRRGRWLAAPAGRRRWPLAPARVRGPSRVPGMGRFSRQRRLSCRVVHATAGRDQPADVPTTAPFSICQTRVAWSRAASSCVAIRQAVPARRLLEQLPDARRASRRPGGRSARRRAGRRARARARGRAPCAAAGRSTSRAAGGRRARRGRARASSSSTAPAPLGELAGEPRRVLDVLAHGQLGQQAEALRQERELAATAGSRPGRRRLDSGSRPRRAAASRRAASAASTCPSPSGRAARATSPRRSSRRRVADARAIVSRAAPEALPDAGATRRPTASPEPAGAERRRTRGGSRRRRRRGRGRGGARGRRSRSRRGRASRHERDALARVPADRRRAGGRPSRGRARPSARRRRRAASPRASASANAARACSPPESSDRPRVEAVVEPEVREQLRRLGTDVLGVLGARSGAGRSCRPAFWLTKVHGREPVAAQLRRRGVCRARGPSDDAARRALGRSSPASARRSVDLPLPGGADDGRDLADA